MLGTLRRAERAPGPPHSSFRRSGPVRPFVLLEGLLIGLLGAATFVVHDVGYLLSQPYWTDEAWVAVTTRYPLADLRETTSSTPIGWSALLRLFVVGGPQRQRMLPLLFAAAAVVAAYAFGRGLGWSDRRLRVLAGTLCALAVLLLPAMLVRGDLKQYTADACVALVFLALLARLGRSWSRGRLAAVALAVPVGMLVSHAAAFVGVAALSAVGIVALLGRRWDRLGETVVASTAAMLGLAVVYLAFDARAVVPGLTRYWRGYFLAGHGLGRGLELAWSRFEAVIPYLALGPAWLVLALVAVGMVTLVRIGQAAVALAVGLLVLEMAALAALSRYPWLDLRTSTFLLVVLAVTAAVGVAGAAAAVARRSGPAATALVALVVVAFVAQAQGHVGGHPIPAEDVRTQVQYVRTHASRADIVLVNLSSNWGFGYYWPGEPSRRPDAHVAQGYVVDYPRDPRIVVASNRSRGAVAEALAVAVRRQTASGGRIWLVRTHVIPAEAKAWQRALSAAGLQVRRVGGAGLSVLEPRPA